MIQGTAITGLFESDLALAGLRRGKVRDVYDLPEANRTPRLLIIASDRISAFDVVMPTPLPGKGKILTEISLFWLRLVERLQICRTHLISTDVQTLPLTVFKPGGTSAADLADRSMIVKRARVVPIECVVRGYLEGSGWKEYKHSGSICGIELPAGLKQCDRLPEPIFTPATKEQLGKHDENITFERACEVVGRPVMERLRSLSLAIYSAASAHAASRGIIIADTKFEFGFEVGGRGAEINGGSTAQSLDDLILIDEALTPDSSRFWPAASWQPGHAQKSFDKQYLREHLEALVARGKWDKSPPGPELPPEVVSATLAKYAEARDLLVK